jgi:hypothetical protein
MVALAKEAPKATASEGHIGPFPAEDRGRGFVRWSYVNGDWRLDPRYHEGKEFPVKIGPAPGERSAAESPRAMTECTIYG